MERPEKRERQITQIYWYCGIDGHYHFREDAAEKCIKRHAKVANNITSNAKKRLADIADMISSGAKTQDVAKNYNVSYSRAWQLIQNAKWGDYKSKSARKIMGKPITDRLETSIDDCSFSVRTANALKQSGLPIKTIADLENIPDSELLKIERLGFKGLLEIRVLLNNITV